LHLDVMPSNVFVRNEGGVALMDFRSGRAQKGRMIAAFPGSEGFRAPELLAGADVNERADIYGLGATLYFMLTGERPVGSFTRISEANPAARRFDLLVSRCLRAIPEERPESVDAFLKELDGSGEGVVLPREEDDLSGWLEVLAYDPKHAQAREVIAKLEAVFRESKEWDNLVVLLLGRSEVEPDAAQRHQTLRDVAGIFENEVGDKGKAFAALQAAFREDASNLELQQDLERLAAATGLWSELVQEYSAVAQHQQEPRVACEWWVRVGRMYVEKLQHEDYAVAAFNHVLSLNANHPEALSALAAVQKTKGDHKEQAKLLARQAKAEEDLERRADLLEQLGSLHANQLGSNEEAIAAYRHALEVAPSQLSTLNALMDLFQKTEMWEELAELMRRRIPLSDISEDLARYRHVLAEVLTEKLDAPDEAIDVLRALIEVNPDDAKALRALERLYDATERNDEYLEVLNKRIAAAKDDHERMGLYKRLAAEWEAQAGGLRRAAEYLRKIHELGGATEDTYRDLVRLYWQLKDYPSLVETYGWHIAVVERLEDRSVLFAALGRVYEEHLEEPEKACDAFESMLEMDGENAIAVASLARVYERLERWSDTADMLDKLAKVGETGERRVDALRHSGVIKGRHLQDLEGAEVALARAFELRGDNLETVVALAELHRSRDDFGKAARMLAEAARISQNSLERVKFLFDAAELTLDKIRDPEKALEIYEQLLEVDPEHLAGAERAVDLLLAAEDFSKALPLLETVLRKTDSSGRKPRLERNLQLANAAQRLGNVDRAEEALRAAHQLDTTSKEALGGLAELLFARESYDEAGKLWQSLLVHHRGELSDDELVEIFFKLGEVRLAQGDASKAQNMVEKALEVEPNNPKVLERAIGIYEKKRDYEAVVRCKRHLLESYAQGSDPWLTLYEAISDLLVQELDRPREALKVYEQILDVRPNLRRILHKEMEVHVSLKSWEGALAAIKEMVSLEEEASHRYRLHNTAAMILRDELKRPEEAAEAFNEALQADPTNMFAFELLKELYTDQKKYDKLVRAYRLMLKRLPAGTPRSERIVLWREMANLAHQELRDGREAIIALESLYKLGGQEKGDEEKLARLYASAGEDAYDKAVTVNQRILDRKPLDRDAYNALFTIYREREEMDKAYCVALALSLLKSANEAQQKLVEELRPRGDIRRATSRMSDDELWRAHIYHPTQNQAISEMLGITMPLFMPMALKERSVMQLKADKQLQPQDDTRPYARTFRYVCEMLEVSPNELYLKPAKDPLSLVAMTEEEGSPSRVLFVDPALVEAGCDERELVFHFTRTLSLMRAEHAILYVSPTPTVIQALALASVRVTNPDYPVQGDVEVIDRLASAFHSDLPASSLDALAKRYDDLVEVAKLGGPERWMRAVELSLDRAGLLLSDDLTTAARLASSTQPLAMEEGLTSKERVAQIFRYAASERYFAARERLGLALRVK
ncbi:MAG: tetratricopeptide repeat protein, partial [Deltaproteobacteria bacterium]|nr:tetratricopeptide repeat protein [Deltaproteobacteria bacterium]